MLYHSELRNFYYNEMEYLDFTEVYLKTLTAEEMDQKDFQQQNPAK